MRISYLLITLIFFICKTAFAETLSYTVSFIPEQEKLEVVVEFTGNDKGQSDINNYGNELKASSNLQSLSPKTYFKNDKQNKKLFFFYPAKQSVKYKYNLVKESNDYQLDISNYFVNKQSFFLRGVHLNIPTEFLDSKTKLILNFNLPTNFVLYHNDSLIPNNTIIYDMDEYFDDEIFLGGTQNSIRISPIKVHNQQVNLLFFNVADKRVPFVSESIRRIYNSLNKFFDIYKIPKTTAILVGDDKKFAWGYRSWAIRNLKNINMFYVNNNDSDDLSETIAWNHMAEILSYKNFRTSIDYYKYYWFNHGFSLYYAYKILMLDNFRDFGIYDLIKQYNNTLGNYYTSRIRNEINNELAMQRIISFIAQNRGGVAAFELDTRIYKDTNGKYSLDDVMKKLISLFQKGEVFTLELLKQNIAVFSDKNYDDIFENIIEYGRDFVPITDIYFIPKEIEVSYVNRYVPEYGFNFATSNIFKKFHNVVKNSNAYKAGIRDDLEFIEDKTRNDYFLEPAEKVEIVLRIKDRFNITRDIIYYTNTIQVKVPEYQVKVQ